MQGGCETPHNRRDTRQHQVGTAVVRSILMTHSNAAVAKKSETGARRFTRSWTSRQVASSAHGRSEQAMLASRKVYQV